MVMISTGHVPVPSSSCLRSCNFAAHRFIQAHHELSQRSHFREI